MMIETWIVVFAPHFHDINAYMFPVGAATAAGCHLALVIPDLLLQGRVLKKAAWIQEFKGDGHIYSTVPEAKAEMNAL